ncbi:hypothetical protein FQN57_006350 [Myotisia sp. PD_48]|nr:hypothetical protein FQN57_006350 [Myotisia sp. PD_48]
MGAQTLEQFAYSYERKGLYQRLSEQMALQNSYTISLNEDCPVYGPVAPETDLELYIELFSAKGNKFFNGNVHSSNGSWVSLPVYFPQRVLRYMIAQFPHIGRAMLSAIPIPMLDGSAVGNDPNLAEYLQDGYIFACATVLEGRLNGKTQSLDIDLNLIMNRIMLGIGYLNVRMLQRQGRPFDEEIWCSIGAINKMDINSTREMVKRLEAGVETPTIDRCRMVIETQFDWQGGVPSEVKVMSWQSQATL